MIIISDRDLPLARRTVLTIGAFDGVHIGHACLLGAMRTVSAEKRAAQLRLDICGKPEVAYERRSKVYNRFDGQDGGA